MIGWLKITVSLLSTVVFAGPCLLDEMIPLKKVNLLKQGLILTHARFDSFPSFAHSPTVVREKQEILSLLLMNIQVNGNRTDILGASVWSNYDREKIGFDVSYYGNPNLNGQVDLIEPSTSIYTTRIQIPLIDSRHAKDSAEISMRVEIVHDRLNSLQLTIPIYQEWKLVGLPPWRDVLMAFSGQYQTLCLRSARRKSG